MSGPASKKDDDHAATKADIATEPSHEDERMEDEEKILAGRDDVNFPALLTKDVPGG